MAQFPVSSSSFASDAVSNSFSPRREFNVHFRHNHRPQVRPKLPRFAQKPFTSVQGSQSSFSGDYSGIVEHFDHPTVRGHLEGKFFCIVCGSFFQLLRINHLKTVIDFIFFLLSVEFFYCFSLQAIYLNCNLNEKT